jgi:cysteine sulfinate desulfinase/cysteine desulfurase-like protein
MIYLDNSATTKPCDGAVEAMTKALTDGWANPSALYGFGFDAAKQLRTARHAVAGAMGAEPDRVFFTSGGTEADNWAIFGTIKRFGKRGKHIITTAIEHHAVLNCMKDLEAQGFEVTYLQPDNLGNISLDSLMSEEIAKESNNTNTNVTGSIIITSPHENVIVTCYKVCSSGKMSGGKAAPQYALYGFSKGSTSFWGEPTTFLGWYADKEQITKERL